MTDPQSERVGAPVDKAGVPSCRDLTLQEHHEYWFLCKYARNRHRGVLREKFWQMVEPGTRSALLEMQLVEILDTGEAHVLNRCACAEDPSDLGVCNARSARDIPASAGVDRSSLQSRLSVTSSSNYTRARAHTRGSDNNRSTRVAQTPAQKLVDKFDGHCIAAVSFVAKMNSDDKTALGKNIADWLRGDVPEDVIGEMIDEFFVMVKVGHLRLASRRTAPWKLFVKMRLSMYLHVMEKWKKGQSERNRYDADAWTRETR